MADTRQMHINLLAAHGGFSPGAWRADSSKAGDFVDVDYFVKAARLAERGKLDALFLPDVPALLEPATRPPQGLDPVLLLTALAAATDRIGLIGTASTSYGEPYNVARRWLSMDHVSGGRIGWNVVASAYPRVARNFGSDAVPPHEERYARAVEFVDVVRGLWDGWEDDAFRGDVAGGRLVEGGKVHALDHEGTFFRVKGPLPLPRSPQGQPVLVQAGASDQGRDLGAAIGEVIFAALPTAIIARDYRADMKARAQAAGRDPDGLHILPGLAVVAADSQTEVERRLRAIEDATSIEDAIRRIATTLEVSESNLQLDAPLPFDRLPPVETVTARGNYLSIVNLAREEGLTLRQIIRRQLAGGAYPLVAGTPDIVADFMADWFLTRAADGFAVIPDTLSEGLEPFIELVLPELRKRGLFRTDYSGSTLRDHFGLARPPRA